MPSKEQWTKAMAQDMAEWEQGKTIFEFESAPVGSENISWSAKSAAAAHLKKVMKTSSGFKTKEQYIQLLKVGADVEQFIRDKAGKPVPVIGLIGGTKEEPLPIISKGFALQEDNVALEYNIPPAGNVYDFVYSLMRVREEIEERLSKHGYVSAIEASMRFDAKQLDHPQARMFGCEPDYNVWEQTVNEKPSATDNTLRTAGGHIHVSFLVNGKPPKHPENITEMEVMIMAMDLFVGVPLTLLDKDKDRRKMYGRAGAFRPKSYGVEYRVPSNFWTKSPALMGWTFDQVRRAVKFINGKADPRASLLSWKGHVYEAINDSDQNIAAAIVSHFGIELPSYSE